MNSYDHITTKHYAAYRPPLHELILEKCITKNDGFVSGLDIGCGTGQSSISLSKYCKKVIGIEPSPDMLKGSIPHPEVEYQDYDGRILNFPDQLFDIITLAGSLYYGKSQKLLDEIVRVGKDSSIILVYDFEILLHNIYKELQIDRFLKNNTYNHVEDFSGLDQRKIKLLSRFQDQLVIKIDPPDLAHLLLSMEEIHMIIVKEHGLSDPFWKLCEILDKLSGGNLFELVAKLYYTKYLSIG